MTQPNKQMESILSLALRSPSVHNTQPWSVKIDKMSFLIYADGDRKLEAGDPTLRGLWTSMGCFVQSILVSSQALGFEADLNIKHFNIDTNNHNFQINITQSNKSTDKKLTDAINNRHSCRDKFQKNSSHLVPSDVERLDADMLDLTLSFLNDPDDIEYISKLHAGAIKTALTIPRFRKELDGLVKRRNKHTTIGLQLDTLTPNLFASVFEKIRLKTGLFLNSTELRERNLFENSGQIILIFADGDVDKYWFNTGRLCLEIMLSAESMGLKQSSSAGPVEAGDLHEEIEEKYAKNKRLQLVIRVGQNSCNHPQTPRRSISGVLLHSV
ncbi:hypothetical protein KBF61_03900 [Candidatus Saccharibacteria bacterium]|jgi:hypothetical protein|nr:hypothetical protein [Candidatus Saccharibacteria bacterium]